MTTANGSAAGSFGGAAVGDATEPCPLGVIEIRVRRADGAALDSDVRVLVSGPSDHDATISKTRGRWTSPKTVPGDYSVSLDYHGRVAELYQPAAAAHVVLPESGEAAVTLTLEPFAVLPVRVVREDDGSTVAGARIVLRTGGAEAELTTDADGMATFRRLTTDARRAELVAMPGEGDIGWEARAPLAVSLEPGANPAATLAVRPLALLRVTAVHDETGAAIVPDRVIITSAVGEATEHLVDADGRCAVALVSGTYDVLLQLGAADQRRFVAPVAERADVASGERRDLAFRLSPAPRRLVIAHASSASGPLAALGSMSYSQAKAALQEAWDAGGDVILPLPGVRPFDDLLFTVSRGRSGGSGTTRGDGSDPPVDTGDAPADGPYYDDQKQALAFAGRVRLFGKDCHFLFTALWGTGHDPRQVTLGFKWSNWSLRDWKVRNFGWAGDHLHFQSGFFIASGAEFDVKTADLPAGAQSFYGWEYAEQTGGAVKATPAEIEVKPGVNLYTRLDVTGFPKLREALGWIGIRETWLKLWGYLTAEVNSVFKAGTPDGDSMRGAGAEITAGFGLVATVPARIPGFLEPVVSEREISLELAFEHERSTESATTTADGTATTKTADESKSAFQVKLKDALKVPIPAFALGRVIEKDAEDVEFAAEWQIEKELDGPAPKPAGRTRSDADADERHGGRGRADADADLKPAERPAAPMSEESSSESAPPSAESTSSKAAELSVTYSTDLKLRLLWDALAIHDFGVEANFSDEKVTFKGEFDIGRFEKMGEIEISHPVKVGTTTPKPKADGSAPAGPPGDGDGPASGPSPDSTVDLESKQSKPQPAPPTQEELDAAPKDKQKRKRWWHDWEVTAKVKPTASIACAVLVNDILMRMIDKAAGTSGAKP